MTLAFTNINLKLNPAQPQIFSLPPDVISHLWKHPCKYFYSKNPIFIFPYTQLEQRYFYGAVSQKRKALTIFCKEKIEDFDDHKLFSPFMFPKWEDLDQTIWLGSELRLRHIDAFTFGGKIYRCTIHTLTFNRAEIPFEEFCILTNEGTVENLTIENRSGIYYSYEERDDGFRYPVGKVQIDVIISKVLKLKAFTTSWLRVDLPLLECLPELSQMKLQNKLEHFEIWFDFYSVTSFNLTFICEFIKRNAASDCKIIFYECSRELLKAAINNLESNLKSNLSKIEIE